MTTTALRATPGVFRWHSYGYSREPTTLVEFVLEGAPEGTRLTITESGFDRLPGAVRCSDRRSASPLPAPPGRDGRVSACGRWRRHFAAFPAKGRRFTRPNDVRSDWLRLNGNLDRPSSARFSTRCNGFRCSHKVSETVLCGSCRPWVTLPLLTGNSTSRFRPLDQGTATPYTTLCDPSLKRLLTSLLPRRRE